MAQYTVRKPETIAGKQYQPGQRVPLEQLRPETRKKLIESRRLVADSVTVSGRKGADMGREVIKRPLNVRDDYRLTGMVTSTAASTALEPRGVIALETTSTAATTPVVYTLQAPRKGDVIAIVVKSLASSSQGPFHVNAGSGIAFMLEAATTSLDMATLSTNGASFEAVALTTARWLVTSRNGATFSTST